MRLEELLHRIQEANAMEIEEILVAAMARKRKLFPGWEIVY